MMLGKEELEKARNNVKISPETEVASNS